MKLEESDDEYEIEEVDDPLHAFESHEEGSSRDAASPSQPPPKKKNKVSIEFSHATLTKITPDQRVSFVTTNSVPAGETDSAV